MKSSRQISSDLGRAIRERRERKGLSQRALAELAGITGAYVSRIEAGGEEVGMAIFVALLAALGVPIQNARKLFLDEAPNAVILDDGSLEVDGLVYLAAGGTLLPAGTKTDGKVITLPDGRTIKPEHGVEFAGKVVLDDDDTLPDGSVLYSDGRVRTPGEPRAGGLTLAESEIISRLRRVPIADRTRAEHVAITVLEAFLPVPPPDARAYLRHDATAVGITVEDIEAIERQHGLTDKPAVAPPAAAEKPRKQGRRKAE